MEALHPALLVAGYAVGVAFYAAAGVTLVRGARTAGRALVAFYWRRRSRREAVATIRRVSREQTAPARRAA